MEKLKLISEFWVLSQPSQSVLLIDRSGLRFESDAEGLERKTSTNKILGFFASFQINQIQNSAIQIHRIKD